MKAVDKFGREIYPKTFRKMQQFGKNLETQGYKESQQKPNLFYKPDTFCVFFADMRGTDIISMWDDPSPLLYWNFIKECPEWQKRRIIKSEMGRLEKVGCPVRLSFYEECEPDGLMFNAEEDGYCKYCGKDFQDSGLYCSEECKLNARRKDLRGFADESPICQACKRKIIDDKTIYDEIMKLLPGMKDRIVSSRKVEHHTSYKEDITMTVCGQCHAKIHHREWCEYTPVDSPSPEKKYKIVPCSFGCGHNTRVKIDVTDPNNMICYKCKKKIERLRKYYPDKIIARRMNIDDVEGWRRTFITSKAFDGDFQDKQSKEAPKSDTIPESVDFKDDLSAFYKRQPGIKDKMDK